MCECVHAGSLFHGCGFSLSLFCNYCHTLARHVSQFKVSGRSDMTHAKSMLVFHRGSGIQSRQLTMPASPRKQNELHAQNIIAGTSAAQEAPSETAATPCRGVLRVQEIQWAHTTRAIIGGSRRGQLHHWRHLIGWRGWRQARQARWSNGRSVRRATCCCKKEQADHRR